MKIKSKNNLLNLMLFLSILLVGLSGINNGYADVSVCKKQYTSTDETFPEFIYDQIFIPSAECNLADNDEIIKMLGKPIKTIKSGDQSKDPDLIRYDMTKTAFGKLKIRTRQLYDNAAGVSYKKALNELITRINVAIQIIEGEKTKTESSFPGSPVHPGLWKIYEASDPLKFKIVDYKDLDNRSVKSEISLSDIAGEPCTGFYDASCDDNYNRVIEYVTLINIGQKITNYYTHDKLLSVSAEIKLREKRWDNYFNKSIPQYPWELAFNSLFLDDNRVTDEDGNKLGPIEPPSHQWIFLHPSPGFEFVDKANDGSRFQPSVNLEIIGCNGWKWDQDASMKTQLGGAALITLSDRSGTDSFGYGLMLHYNGKYAIGVTYRDDGDWGVTMNIDLGELLKENFKKYQDRLKEVKPVFQ